MSSDNKLFDNKWLTIYNQKNSSFFVEAAGYFDERPVIHTSVTQILVLLLMLLLLFFSAWALLLIPFVLFGYGTMYIHLPIKTGIDDCDSAAWGFNYHDNKIWIYIGGAGNFEGGRKWKTITMPWEMNWIRTSYLMKDGSIFTETKKQRLDWGASEDTYSSHAWLERNKWQETHDFLDKYDDTTIQATISVEEREWRQRWLRWTSLFNYVRKEIKIEFSDEVGEKKGSWKGGTVGCSYDLLSDETPASCLKRMEKERKF